MITHYSLIKSILFNNGRAGQLPVKGYSMWPFLKNGQTVKISSIKKSLKCGKCYLFIYRNELYVHRLLRVKGKKAFFIGDYSEVPEKVPLEAVIGELELNQNAMTVLLLNVLNYLFVFILPGFVAEMRIRCKIFALITSFGVKVNERKI